MGRSARYAGPIRDGRISVHLTAGGGAAHVPLSNVLDYFHAIFRNLTLFRSWRVDVQPRIPIKLARKSTSPTQM